MTAYDRMIDAVKRNVGLDEMMGYAAMAMAETATEIAIEKARKRKSKPNG